MSVVGNVTEKEMGLQAFTFAYTVICEVGANRTNSCCSDRIDS